MIRANKISGGTALTCQGVGSYMGSNIVSCCVTNPQDATETAQASSASGGTNLTLPNGFGTITNMGVNSENKAYIRFMPGKNCKLHYVSLSSSTIPPAEVTLTSGQQYDLLFADGVSFIMY